MQNKLKYIGIMSLAVMAITTSQGAFAGTPDPVQDPRLIAYGYDGQVPVADGESEFTAYQYIKSSIDQLGEYSSGAPTTNTLNTFDFNSIYAVSGTELGDQFKSLTGNDMLAKLGLGAGATGTFGGLDKYNDQAKTALGDQFKSLTGNDMLAKLGLGAGALGAGATGALGNLSGITSGFKLAPTGAGNVKNLVNLGQEKVGGEVNKYLGANVIGKNGINTGALVSAGTTAAKTWYSSSGLETEVGDLTGQAKNYATDLGGKLTDQAKDYFSGGAGATGALGGLSLGKLGDNLGSYSFGNLGDSLGSYSFGNLGDSFGSYSFGDGDAMDFSRISEYTEGLSFGDDALFGEFGDGGAMDYSGIADYAEGFSFDDYGFSGFDTSSFSGIANTNTDVMSSFSAGGFGDYLGGNSGLGGVTSLFGGFGGGGGGASASGWSGWHGS